jgi:cell division protein FtsB
MDFTYREDGHMSRLDRLLLVAATAAVLVGVLYVATVLAQSPSDLQRQIDRLQVQVDNLQALRERVAAAEREIELNRKVVWGFLAMLAGNFAVSGLTLQRVTRIRPNNNSQPGG